MVKDTQLKSEVETYLSEGKATGIDQCATFLATSYHRNIGIPAMDPVGNVAIRATSWDDGWGDQDKQARGPDEAKPPNDWKWDAVTGEYQFTGGKVKGLYDAWKKCFEMQAKVPVSLGKPPYLLPATAIITYWTGQSFLPVIPHSPGFLPGISNMITFSGTPMKMASEIYDAFTSKKYETVAKKYTDSVVKHLDQIKGIWTGPHPGSPPYVAPVNWSKLQ